LARRRALTPSDSGLLEGYGLEVDISPMSVERFAPILEPDRFAAFTRAVETARQMLSARVVWNVNSTARGGGVVELLQPLVAYARGAGAEPAGR